MKKYNSMYVRLLKLLLLATVVSIVYFCVIDSAGSFLVGKFYADSTYVADKDKEYIDRLEAYAARNHVGSKDTKELNRWVRKQRFISIQIFHDNILTYDSDYPEEDKIWEEEVGKSFYDWGDYFTVSLEDGKSEVAIYGSYAYQLYTYAMIIEIFLSFGIFLLVVILGIRKTIHYIGTLSNEIEILEGGNLDYPITIRGKDELTVLAIGLDNMRKSFKAQVEKKDRVVRLNQKMVTEMSHDLRTPLTSIMIYTEILKKEQYSNEDQRKEYIDKIYQKTNYMKQLTDNLFEYSLISSEREVTLEEPIPFKTAFYDLLSESIAYLRQQDFQIETKLQWPDCQIQINTDYVLRIFDNIVSNIIKYADPDAPVKITTVCQEEKAGFCFENKKKILYKKSDSTHIGIPNIVRMISRMEGSCDVEEENHNFKINIYFHV